MLKSREISRRLVAVQGVNELISLCTSVQTVFHWKSSRHSFLTSAVDRSVNRLRSTIGEYDDGCCSLGVLHGFTDKNGATRIISFGSCCSLHSIPHSECGFISPLGFLHHIFIETCCRFNFIIVQKAKHNQLLLFSYSPKSNCFISPYAGIAQTFVAREKRAYTWVQAKANVSLT